MSAATSTAQQPMTSYDQYQSDDHEWPFDVVPVDPRQDRNAIVWKGDREYLFKATDGNVYQGRYCRAMVDNAKITDQPLWLGFDVAEGKEVPLSHRHLYRGGFIGGRPGTGKTTFASNVMLQLAHLQHGFMFLDPGGEEYQSIIRRMPEHARDKTVVYDPTSSWRGRDIGFNFLDTYYDPGDPQFTKEVEAKVGAILPMLNAEYPRMKAVAESMLRALIQAHKSDDGYDYCLIDLYHALSNTEEYAHMVEENRLEFLAPFARQIEETLGEEELEPLLRRVRKWIESDLIRPLVAQRTTDLSIEQVVRDDMHLIMNVELQNKDAQQMLMMALSQLLWTVIFTRPSVNDRKMMEFEGVDVPDIGGQPKHSGDQFKPFFFIADEFHTLSTEEADLGRTLALGRKKRLGIIALSQQAGQLDKDDKNAIKRNTAFKLAYHPGDDIDEARYLSKAMPGKDIEDFTGLDRFHAITMTEDAEKAFEAHMLPLYPPKRSLRKANEWFNETLDRWGHDAGEGNGPDVSRFAHNPAGGEMDDNADMDAPDDTTLPVDERQRLLCKATYDEALHTHEDGHEWVSYPDVHDRFNRYTDTDHTGAQVASILQGTTEVKFDDRSGKQLRCTEDGFARFMPGTDPGDDAEDDETKQTQGGVSHHSLLHDAYDDLTLRGLEVSVEEQSGGADVDGIGRLRESFAPEVDPDDFGAYAEAVDTFREENPDLAALTGLGDVTIEAESSTSGKPAATCQNLHKAHQTDRICLFLARPEDADKVYGTLADPPYVRKREGGDVWLNSRKRLVCDDEYVLRPAGAERTRWWIRDGVLELYDSEGRGPHATIDPPESVFDDGASEAFPAVESDVAEDAIGEGEEYRYVARPWIPEVEFDGDVPDEDAWRLLVVSRDGEVSEYEAADGDEAGEQTEDSDVWDRL